MTADFGARGYGHAVLPSVGVAGFLLGWTPGNGHGQLLHLMRRYTATLE
jgi:hypothetical protein